MHSRSAMVVIVLLCDYGHVHVWMWMCARASGQGVVGGGAWDYLDVGVGNGVVQDGVQLATSTCRPACAFELKKAMHIPYHDTMVLIAQSNVCVHIYSLSVHACVACL